MERTERYDPEDLEQLMLERSFDELLGEERAFALRHLQGRAEYEQMRALLLHLQQDAGQDSALEADPAVRERVLQVFRGQQRPQWRIWLNALGGFLVPQRPALYWRPALALCTAAVVFVGAWRLMDHRPDQTQLALVVKQDHGKAEHKAAGPAVHSEPLPQGPTPATGFSETTSVPPPKTPPAADEPAAPAGTAVADTQRLAALKEAETTSLAADIVSVPAPKEEANREHHSMAAAEAFVDKTEPQYKATAATVSRKGLTSANSNAGAYSEDDLLGLLQAAW
jgi:hypothetical protein